MKTTHKLIALCAFTVLPLGAITAGQTATTIKAEAEKQETQTITLKVTGMT